MAGDEVMWTMIYSIRQRVVRRKRDNYFHKFFQYYGWIQHNKC